MFRFVATVGAISVLAIVACSPQTTPSKEEERPAAQSETVPPPAAPAQTIAPADNANGRKEAANKSAPIAKPASQGGLVVVVDPVTHQIREATPAEIAALRPPTPASATVGVSKTPIYLSGPGGAVGIALDSESEVYTIVTKTPDGKLQMQEVTGEKAAKERVLSGTKQKSANEK